MSEMGVGSNPVAAENSLSARIQTKGVPKLKMNFIVFGFICTPIILIKLGFGQTNSIEATDELSR